VRAHEVLSPLGGSIKGTGSWNPGQKQPPPHGLETLSFTPSEVPGRGKCYPLVISAYVPRPIALVSSISSKGVVNLAPYSYSGAAAHNPPTIFFSTCRKPGGVLKDTTSNVLESGECVVHVMSDWWVEAANHTCGNFPPEDDEFDLAGLTKVASSIVKPPRVQEAGIAMECRISHSHDITTAAGEVTATSFLAEVVMFHIHEALLDKGDPQSGPWKVKLAELAPVSRLGGDSYGVTTQFYDLPRPDRPSSGR